MKSNLSHALQLDDINTSVLAKTGQSVSCRLPNRRELVERDVHQLEDSEMVYQPALSAETQLLQELIDAGQMTVDQQVVIMHDQATTGMTVAEILIARGWL